ncbi:PHP domain-containing protein [Sinorhizobium numidicum]|uniref:PHP domain-containing protein n=1 Tax=Sinorhizobium numidicum TaxID=680248 RepID=A0ABY8CSR5_9HYPH|nr:PHP domain-containing protein [Sinorhizobium numidicum]WEX75627.1 PHP domain-containing protein [Sinorhizobium numidicum]WEX81624.1 PHP domain-containing protein [Sinorhizobium numidicum]
MDGQRKKNTSKPAFCRFRDLSQAQLNVELQVHTSWTDGQATALQILETAKERGLGALAFTEHVREETTWFNQFREEVLSAARGFEGIRVYVGCETKAMDDRGRLDVSQDVLDACDIVLGVVHRLPDGKGGYLDFKQLSFEQTAEIEFRLSMGMIWNAPIDVLGHPGGMSLRRHGRFPKAYYRELMTASLERQIALEINSSYLVDMPAFLALCDEINPFVSIGSDAHRLSELGRCRDQLIELGVGQS